MGKAMKATHLIVSDKRRISACGMPWVEHGTKDPKKVDCLKCRKTWEFRRSLKGGVHE